MNERIKQLAEQSTSLYQTMDGEWEEDFDKEKFAELILANADELKRMMNTDPINKPFELDQKWVAKCDLLGRSRRQFQ
jgi:hypothetical protein